MKNNDSTKNSFEKKTERLDIRVSHKKKQAFTKACEDQGDTPSHAVRRFITTYTRRAKQDNFSAAIRSFPWRRTAIALTAIIALGYGSLTLWWYTVQAKTTRVANMVFSIYDENQNGLLELGEIAPNDFHLHRVLNIDGQDGISLEEFYSKGTMHWEFVDPDNFQIIENKKGWFKQSTVTRSVTKTIQRDGANDPDKKGYIMVDGAFVEFKSDAQLLEIIDSSSNDYEKIRAHGGLPKISPKHLEKYNVKVVRFDLSNPDKLELTIYEQSVGGLTSHSPTNFQRSVTWVEGRKTPELVIGAGRNKAVLTKDIQMN